jgi:hypothetical protein
MKLIVQPDAGVAPIVGAIRQAKKSIDILIFRLDRFEIAHALAAAVARGVRVRALTAHTNRGGTKSLRKLEMSLLEAGVTVSRTADDLVRYHGQMMIVDNKFLHVYGFNFTGLDIAKSRSFGVINRSDQGGQKPSWPTSRRMSYLRLRAVRSQSFAAIGGALSGGGARSGAT